MALEKKVVRLHYVKHPLLAGYRYFQKIVQQGQEITKSFGLVDEKFQVVNDFNSEDLTTCHAMFSGLKAPKHMRPN